MKNIVIPFFLLLSACSPKDLPFSVFIEASEWRTQTHVAIKWWNEQADLVNTEHLFILSHERDIADLVLTSSSGVGIPEATAWYVEHEAKVYLTQRMWVDKGPDTVIAHELGHFLGLNHTDPGIGNNVLTPALSCWIYDPDQNYRCPNLTPIQVLTLDLPKKDY